MATIQQYKKSDGTTAWLYKVYMGKDPMTGKEKRTTRRGFKTKKEASLDLARFQLEIESNGISQHPIKTFSELYDLWMSQHVKNIRNTKEQRIKTNPMERTITPKSNHDSAEIEAEFYTKEELRQFFDCLQELKDDRALAFFRLAAYTGARKGEILGLTWKDIDFDKKRLCSSIKR